MKNNIRMKLLSAILAALLVLTATVNDCQVSVYAEETPEDTFTLDDEDEQSAFFDSDAADITNNTEGANREFSYGYREVYDEPTIEYAPVQSSAKDNSLPSSYGYEQFKDYMPPLINQYAHSTCWVVSSLSLVEISLLKQGYVTMDSCPNLSVIHSAWFSYHSVVDPLGGTEGDVVSYKGDAMDGAGGSDYTAAMAFSEWRGVAEYNPNYYKYPNYQLPDELAYQSIAKMNGFYQAETVDDAKKLIMKYGGVTVGYVDSGDSYNKKTNAYYDTLYLGKLPRGMGHQAVIVGWDDSFSKDNFLQPQHGDPWGDHPPKGDGAWLIRNSWMDGDYEDKMTHCHEGYFWMSYYSETINSRFVAFDFSMGDRIDHNYQFDGSTVMHKVPFKTKRLLLSNVYTAQEDELVQAASFYTYDVGTKYEAKIYRIDSSTKEPTDGELVATAGGAVAYAGYNYVRFDAPALIEGGSAFSVVIDVSTTGEEINAVVENGYDKPDVFVDVITSHADPYESWVSTDGGSTWVDIGAQENGNLRIKAFTNTVSRTIHLDMNDGTGDELKPKTARIYEAVGELPVPSRKGYTFVGWYTDAQGGTLVGPDYTLEKFEKHVLYAHWTPKQYTVSFDPTGGECDTNSISVVYQQAYGELPVATRAGYLFDGWMTNDGDDVTGQSIVTAPEDQTLKAKWRGPTCIVTFDIGENTYNAKCDTLSKVVVPGEKYGELPIPESESYAFMGWKLVHNGSTFYNVTDSNTVQITEDHTLEAVWDTPTVNITYSPNGYGNIPTYRQDQDASGTWVSKKQSKETTRKYGASYGLHPQVKPFTSEITFIGWFTEPDGGRKVEDNEKVLIPANHTLYAHWDAPTERVSFDANGGVCDTEYIEVETWDSGAPCGALPVPERYGYKFNGWYISLYEGYVPEYYIDENARVEYVAGKILSADWSPISHTVSFDANGGVPIDKMLTVVFDDTYGESGIIEDAVWMDKDIDGNSEYRFVGWYTDPQGGDYITEDTTVSTVADETLYAHWVRADGYNPIIDPAITENPNDPSVGDKNKDNEGGTDGQDDNHGNTQDDAKKDDSSDVSDHDSKNDGNNTSEESGQDSSGNGTQDNTGTDNGKADNGNADNGGSQNDDANSNVKDNTDAQGQDSKADDTSTVSDGSKGTDDAVVEEEDNTQHSDESLTAVSADGSNIALDVDVSYPGAMDYTGAKIVADKAFDASDALSLKVDDVQLGSILTVSYTTKNNTAAYVHGDPQYNAKKRPYFFAKIKINAKALKASKLTKKQVKSVKATVSAMNKKLKADKCYFDITPATMSDSNITIVTSVSKKTGVIKVKAVKFKNGKGKWVKLAKKDYVTPIIDQEARTVAVAGKRNMSGTITITVK